MRKRLLIGAGALALVLIAGAFAFFSRAEAPAPVAQDDRAEQLPPAIELADTPALRTLGLSGREEVPDDYGMLFIFDEDGKHSFWMKDMRVSIDIIWIAADGRIVHIEKEVSPDTYPAVFVPETPARYALETRAGYAEDHGWGIGTELDLSAYAK